jgi:hypothetical protein
VAAGGDESGNRVWRRLLWGTLLLQGMAEVPAVLVVSGLEGDGAAKGLQALSWSATLH